MRASSARNSAGPAERGWLRQQWQGASPLPGRRRRITKTIPGGPPPAGPPAYQTTLLSREGGAREGCPGEPTPHSPSRPEVAKPARPCGDAGRDPPRGRNGGRRCPPPRPMEMDGRVGAGLAVGGTRVETRPMAMADAERHMASPAPGNEGPGDAPPRGSHGSDPPGRVR